MNKIWITGNGMVGKALAKNLANNQNYKLLFTTKSELDQTDQEKTDKWIKENRPNTIIISSALVGGIQLNSKIPATFLYQNSMINLNIINSARLNGCQKIVFLGTQAVCIQKIAVNLLKNLLYLMVRLKKQMKVMEFQN